MEERYAGPIGALPQSAQEAGKTLLRECAQRQTGDLDRIARALDFANKAHSGQLRKSGLPYITHPIEVARIAAGSGLDEESVCAALLHDVLEDTSAGKEQIESAFGKVCAGLVEGLTKIGGIKLADGAQKRQQSSENLRKMVLAMSKDLRVVLIKLCDRLHNMRTLGSMPREKALRIARETQEIYAPIAGRLGLGPIKDELLNLCFETRYPWRSRIIKNELEKRHLHHKNYVEKAAVKLLEALESEGIEAAVTGRRKSAHSAYMKMKEKSLKLNDVLDREGFRVFVDSRSECYCALGAVHGLWKPLPGCIKDYIALPKANGYRSLHTAVLNELGNPMEIQIRTPQMHRICEHGVCAHWMYKESKQKGKGDLEQDAWMWMQSLMDIHKSSRHSDEFIDNIKTDLFSDEVHIFTPAGEVVSLPNGASALDFAFCIHSDIGLKAKRAWVNGEIREIFWKLESGDRVKIECAQDICADAMWLGYVKTGRAKAHIRSHLRTLETLEAQKIGQALVIQSLAELGFSQSCDGKEGWEAVKKSLGIEREETLAKLAHGSVSPLAVARVLCKRSLGKGEPAQKIPVKISGEESDFVKFARCCSPLPPMPIAGKLKANEGLVVHSAACPCVAGKEGLVSLAWESSALTKRFRAVMKIKAKNVRGALASIAGAFAKEGADVVDVKIMEKGGASSDYAHLEFSLMVRSRFHLDRLAEKIGALADVASAKG